MKFTKFLTAILFTACATAFSACEKNGEDTNTNTNISLTVQSKTYNTAIVAVSGASKYFLEVEKTSVLETLDFASAAEYAEYRVNAVKQQQIDTGIKTWDDVLHTESTATLSGLSPSTEYVAFAVCVDTASGTVSSSTASVQFTTEEFPQLEGQQFTVTFENITHSSAEYTIVPENPEYYWWFDIVEQNSFDTGVYRSAYEVVENYIEIRKYYIELGYESWAELIRDGYLLRNSYYDKVEGFTASTTYVIVAGVIDVETNGTILKVETYPFTTLDPVKSDIEFDVVVNHGIVEVTPSNDDRYYYAWGPASQFEGKSDDEIVAMYEPIYVSRLKTGYLKNDYMTLDYIQIGSTYTVVLFGYDGGRTTDTVTRHDFVFDGVDRKVYSTFDHDIVHTPTNAFFTRSNSGTIRTWMLSLPNRETNEYMSIELYAAANNTTGVGTYTVEAGSDEPGIGNYPEFSFARGRRWSWEVDNYITQTYDGSFYGVYPTDVPDMMPKPQTAHTQFAAFESGSVTVEYDFDTTLYTFKVDVLDTRGNRMTAEYTGPVYNYNGGRVRW